MLYKPTCHRIVTLLEILVWLNRGRRKSTSLVFKDLPFLKMSFVRIGYRCFAQTSLAGLTSLQNNFCPSLYFSASGATSLFYNAGGVATDPIFGTVWLNVTSMAWSNLWAGMHPVAKIVTYSDHLRSKPVATCE
jgi:hypothetical protein